MINIMNILYSQLNPAKTDKGINSINSIDVSRYFPPWEYITLNIL